MLFYTDKRDAGIVGKLKNNQSVSSSDLYSVSFLQIMVLISQGI